MKKILNVSFHKNVRCYREECNKKAILNSVEYPFKPYCTLNCENMDKEE